MADQSSFFVHLQSLADFAQELQMFGKIWAPHRCADAPAVPRQRLHCVAAQKTGAPEDCGYATLFPSQMAFTAIVHDITARCRRPQKVRHERT